ncbi:MAG: Na+/H+ antiporter NhaC family protein, partial [Muribaculaceae bacterium]|nr:Na+/H+ antiporter NhaC family protein [Muribaculaceae bacterium]
LVTLAVYALLPVETVPVSRSAGVHSPWLILPYLVVIVLAVARVNVSLVLTLGIVSALILGYCFGFGSFDMMGYMGSGIDSMGNLIIITLLSAGMLGIIRAVGGIAWLLQCLTSRVSGRRGGQACIAVLVSIVNLCTANNTVAIITVGSISKEISGRYGISPQKSASLLDTCSCIVQCLIPYGAQTLLATSLAGISPAAPFPYLYYAWALAVMVLLSIVFLFPRSINAR